MYDESIRYGSRRRQIDRIVGTISFVFGIALVIYFENEFIAPYILIAVGIVEFFFFDLWKPFWMRKQLRTKSTDREVNVVLTEDCLEIDGPFSSGTIKWDGIEKKVETPSGFLLWVGRGAHLYFPRELLTSEAADFLSAKAV